MLRNIAVSYNISSAQLSLSIYVSDSSLDSIIFGTKPESEFLPALML